MPEANVNHVGRRLLRSAATSVAPASLLVVRGSARSNSVALTFDDGPDELTRDYLDVLDHLGVFCTFFVLGKACANRPDDLREIVRRGHEVALHGYSHKAFSVLDRHDLEDELERTAALLPPAPLPRPMVRPPAGATTLSSLATCAVAGYTTVLWSVDSDDCRTSDVEEVVARVSPGRVTAGDIVLLHEGQPWTLAALPRIVGQLRDAGLRLSTVGEMLMS